MNYEKKYKEALEAIKKIQEANPHDEGLQNWINDHFPELSESEDERIRKQIISFLKEFEYDHYRNLDFSSWIAWLEKQKTIDVLDKEEREFANSVDSYRKDMDEFYKKGYNAGREAEKQYWFEKQADKPKGKTALEAWKDMRLEVYQQASGNRHEPNYSDDTSKMFSLKDIDEIFEKIAELHEDNSTDKVEPKFHEGDWVASGILWNSSSLLHILNVDSKDYEVETPNGNTGVPSINYIDSNFHLWSIEDAKDGDVLCYKDEISLFEHDIKNCTEKGTNFGGFVYHCCYDGKRFITDSLYSLTEQDKIDIHPATKEQRDTLMNAMADAGYEWDAKDKQLNKIES